MHRLRNERGIVLNWLFKLALAFVVVGVIGYDVGSIIVNRIALDSAADDLAVSLSLAFQNAPPSEFTNEEVVRETQQLIEEEHDGLEDARIVRRATNLDPQGIVHVKLRRTADTLIAGRISALDDWVRGTGEGQAGTR